MSAAVSTKIKSKTNSFDPAVRSLGELYARAQNPDTPADVKEGIEKVLDMMDKRDEYARKNTVPDTSNARMIYQKTLSTNWEQLHADGKAAMNYNPLMQSSTGQGQFLQFLIRMQKAKRTLEIGTYTGYVAMAMAEALPEDGVVVTLELDPFLCDMFRKDANATTFGKKIDIRQGKAIDSMYKLASEGQKFDVVYLDCDKPSYMSYYKSLIDNKLLAVGGTLVVDNAFEFGKTYTMPTSLVDDVNKAIMADARIEQVLLPMFDGMSLIRWKGE